MNKVIFISIMIVNQSFAQNHTQIWQLGSNYYASDCGIDFSSEVADTFSVC